jgi:RNA polymerase I-specific transcription initiation factor RRN7
MSPRGPICGVENCRSRRYEEGEDGFLYCQNGHQQAGLVRGEDDDDYVGAARTVTRKKKETGEDPKSTGKIYKGPRGFDLYLKCLQTILQRQVWFLTKDRGLPIELEAVTRDLWSLRIAQLGDRIASQDEESSESHSQQQVFSTMDSEDDATDNEKGHLRDTKGKRSMRLSAAPNLNDCLVLCYLGILTLRLPFTPGDVYAWVTDGKLAYRRAIKLLPLDMRDRLSPGYHAVLDPRASLTYTRFYKTLTDLQLSYSKDHGIIWPALNVPLLLFRYLKELALPLELYDATKRLGDLLGYDFAPHYDGKKRLSIRHLAEAQLVSCIIICIKILYPLDNEKRYPKSSSESTAAMMNWQAWREQMQAAEEARRGGGGRLTTEELARVQGKDILLMGAEEMDQYLDFYADAYLDDAEIQRTKDVDDFQNALYDLFPIDTTAQHPPKESSHTLPLGKRLEVIKAVQGVMEIVPVVPEENTEVLRVGQAYPIWKSAEELPESAKALYREAAKIAGLSMNMLILAVKSTEARVEEWKRAQKRRA